MAQLVVRLPDRHEVRTRGNALHFQQIYPGA